MDATDHVLYALFVTGRVGLWFALAGLFFIYATLPEQGRAALDALEQYRWYLSSRSSSAACSSEPRGSSDEAATPRGARSGPGRD